MNKVLIGIPTFFGNNLAVNCVASILQNVPDADIRVLKNDMGWLKACNKIMVEAPPDSDVLLMNDDTFVLCNIVKELQDVAYSDEKIGIVGGKALGPDRDIVINYGIYIATDGNTAHKYFGKHKNEITKIEKQKAVEGSAWYIKRDVIDKIGLMEEKYGMGYRAEVAYCFKAREAGYDIMSSPTAEYVHFTSQTMGKLGITNDTHEIFMEDWGSKLRLGEI